MIKAPLNRGFVCRRCDELPVVVQLENCGKDTGKWFYRVRRSSQCKYYKREDCNICRTELFAEHYDAAMSWLTRLGLSGNRPPTPAEIKRGLEIAKEFGLLTGKAAGDVVELRPKERTQ